MIILKREQSFFHVTRISKNLLLSLYLSSKRSNCLRGKNGEDKQFMRLSEQKAKRQIKRGVMVSRWQLCTEVGTTLSRPIKSWCVQDGDNSGRTNMTVTWLLFPERGNYNKLWLSENCELQVRILRRGSTAPSTYMKPLTRLGTGETCLRPAALVILLKNDVQHLIDI